MCDALDWLYGALKSIDWLEVIRTLAPVATALIAFLALKNWRRQDKAKREAEFLDELLETVQIHLADMQKPITVLDAAKFYMIVNMPPLGRVDNKLDAIKGAISYIEKFGEREGKYFMEAFEVAELSAIKLRSLTVKGHIFKFNEYEKCLNAVANLAWCSSRMHEFALFISSPHQNWENVKVMERLNKEMTLDADEMRTKVQENHNIIINFARDAYQKIYG